MSCVEMGMIVTAFAKCSAKLTVGAEGGQKSTGVFLHWETALVRWELLAGYRNSKDDRGNTLRLVVSHTCFMLR